MARRRRRRIGGLGIGLVLSLSLLVAGPASTGTALAASTAKPNRFDPMSRARSIAAHPPPASSATTQAKVRGPQRQPAAALSPPATVTLDPSRPSRVTTADSALEVDVPAGAVSASDVAAAGGATSLLVRQVAPASGGSAGGSGHATSGTFLVQVLDSSGHLARQGLRQPIGIKLHNASRAPGSMPGAPSPS